MGEEMVSRDWIQIHTVLTVCNLKENVKAKQYQTGWDAGFLYLLFCFISLDKG